MRLNVEPYEAFQRYMAFKLHFTTKTYDMFKYGGKTKVSEDKFQTRKDKGHFYYLSKVKDLDTFLLAQFVEGNGKFWVGEFRGEQAQENLREFKRRRESLHYKFKSDLSQMDDEFDKNLVVPPNGHPELMKLYLRKKVCIETLIILNRLCKFMPHWSNRLSDDIVAREVIDKCRKYAPFLISEVGEFDKYKASVKDRFSMNIT